MARKPNRREGRGHLSSIDMLPDEAEAAIVWANDCLRERKLPTAVIHAEFNEKLADLGLGPISKSAFGRYAVRKAIQFRRLDEIQRIGGELARTMEAKAPDEVTVAVAELVKVAAFEILEEGEVSTAGLMQISRALQSAVAAQKTSAEYRERLEKEVQARLAEAAKEAGEIGKKKGVSPEALAAINRALMGQG
ncbi:phage protein Gp27 family protein [Erythrobacter tepidarius]|uniref:phage protein Gp27 family protein n=1 Tax=Erythrobacter tepidarius TaxID=60454 RepID=UPI0013026D9A|nr:phage protein Gp27 family protein [Erythrobacter tepidarius]